MKKQWMEDDSPRNYDEIRAMSKEERQKEIERLEALAREEKKKLDEKVA